MRDRRNLVQGARRPEGRGPHPALVQLASLKNSDARTVGDILPTGYSVAKHAWKFLPEEAKQYDTTVAVLGCGPVGICGVLAAKQMFKTVFAIDSVPERLEHAKKAGAIPIDLTKNPIEAIKAQTNGRGTDAVLCVHLTAGIWLTLDSEIVGSPEALDLAIGLIRVGGVISSCGLHHKELKINGMQLYLKNIMCGLAHRQARLTSAQLQVRPDVRHRLARRVSRSLAEAGQGRRARRLRREVGAHFGS